MRHLLALAAAALLATAAAPDARANTFNERFEGQWRGAGTVQRKSDSSPRNVTCSVRGEGDAERIAIAGRCRAALIFTRAIGADLVVDENGRYEGVYTGARSGPARLTGTVKGDTIDLTVRFADAGRGTARMIIENPEGSDSFTLRVVEEGGDGRQELTNLVFQRQ